MDPSTVPPSADAYSHQIAAHYLSKPETHLLDSPFLTLHSDYLHLTLAPDGSLWTKSLFQHQDIILEIRGGTVREEKLQQIMLGRPNSYGPLLWLDIKEKVLIRPRGASQYLVRSSLVEYQSKKGGKVLGNCYIEQQQGSKLLVKASDIIGK